MLYSLTGKLAHTEPGLAVIDVGGVAFKCFTSMGTLRALPRLGEKATLFTYLNVREDALDLFGFATKGELSCFRPVSYTHLPAFPRWWTSCPGRSTSTR